MRKCVFGYIYILFLFLQNFERATLLVESHSTKRPSKMKQVKANIKVHKTNSTYNVVYTMVKLTYPCMGCNKRRLEINKLRFYALLRA